MKNSQQEYKFIFFFASISNGWTNFVLGRKIDQISDCIFVDHITSVQAVFKVKQAVG